MLSCHQDQSKVSGHDIEKVQWQGSGYSIIRSDGYHVKRNGIIELILECVEAW